MSIFDVLSLIGGLALFLFGMSLMGSALEKRAGNKLKIVLSSMTSNTFKGFLLGLGVTAIIQSSSATTVMVVGFVNSGIMTLKQAVGVIMGANLGTSVTSWILSLTGIEGDNLFVQLLKPSSFVPIVAMIGAVMYMFLKSQKKKDTGLILIGFAILMFGMDMMSEAVAGLKEVPEFTRILILFSNPILGVIVGTVFTAIIQSSSASVGILQALTMTGSVTYATAVPIIMGQNIGTCVSAMISSVGASKNARRAAVIHLSFNIIATLILLPLYYVAENLFLTEFAATVATPLGIAVVHTTFKILALGILMPCTKQLEKIACFIVRDDKKDETTQMLDERLLATPAVAVEHCRIVALQMAEVAVNSVKTAMSLIGHYDEKIAEKIIEDEDKVDKYEDKLGSYLVKLSNHDMAADDNIKVNSLLHMIGDFERLSDHAVNIVESSEEISDKRLEFSSDAQRELGVMINAVEEILDLSLKSFNDNDRESAHLVEPLEEIVDRLKSDLKKQHIMRLQRQECTIEMGFVLTDIVGNLERVSDHCSNIAGCMLEAAHDGMDIHEYLKGIKDENRHDYRDVYEHYRRKYDIKA